MARYLFDHWEDGSTEPTRTITVTADMTITATYVLAPPPTRRVTYQSTPISVEAIIDTTPVPPGAYVEVPEGTEITIVVPSEAEA